jgi:protein-disulfide isomerase
MEHQVREMSMQLSLKLLAPFFLSAVIIIAGSSNAWAQTLSHPTEEEAAIVRAVLQQHPELVTQALEADKRNQAIMALAAHRDEIEHDPIDQVRGNPSGDITIVEFTDYQCPYCKAMVTPVEQLLAADPKIRFVIKEFPVLAPISMDAAKVALAGTSDGLYNSIHDTLMARRQPLDLQALRETALSAGMSASRLDAALKDADVEAALKKHVELGNAIGLTGTPTFIIGNERLVGAVTPQQLSDAVVKARTELHKS